mmetsp:Transcript_29921/g.74768  ORF Transcript_29921/g.74768 Transcript_29921/m.74768 type:complete len:130 (+) Transcript_29921:200-589(+)
MVRTMLLVVALANDAPLRLLVPPDIDHVIGAFDETLTFLNLEPQKPVLSFCDNKSAVLIAESDLSTKRMKHVLTKMAYLQERIKERLITIVHIGNEGMLADIGTKRLSPMAFHRLRVFLVQPHTVTPAA